MKRVAERSIRVPCELLKVRAILAPNDGYLSTLSQLVLEAIGKSPKPLDLDGVVALFSLGYRPTLDLVQELWTAGHVAVDPEDGGTLSLTAGTRALLEQGALPTLPSARREERVFTLCRELLTGHFLLRFARRSDALRGQAVEPLVDGCEGQLTEYEFAEVEQLVRGLSKLTFAGATLSLQELIPLLPKAGGPLPRSEFEARVRVERHPETEELLVEVRHGRISAPIRAEMAAAVQRLLRDKPALILSKNLAAAADRAGRDAVQPLERVLGELEEACAELESIPVHRLADHHDECAALATDAIALLAWRTSRRVDVDVLSGSDAIYSAIRTAIRSAESQVLLACPFARGDGYARFRDELEDAVQRGVQVLVLWGIGVEEQIDPEFAAALALLEGAGRSDRVVRSTESARSHAKLVLADSRIAVLGSANFLDSRSAAVELGVRVSAPDEGPSRAVVDLLDWARTVAPDRVRGAIRIESVQPVTAPLTVEIPAKPQVSGDSADPVLRESWRDAWRGVVAALREAAHEGISCGVVRDGEHRAFLLRAVTSARWRLLITSDKLSQIALDAGLMQKLAQRLEAGLRVALVWRGGPADTAEPVIAELERLALRYPGTLTLHPTRIHAKLLLWDDEVVVSSFNFLSFEGNYDEGRRLYRLRRELGLHLSGEGVADLALDGLIREFAARDADSPLRDWQREARRPDLEPSVAIQATGIHPLIAALAEAGPDRRARDSVLARHFASCSDPAADLESLLANELSPADARAAQVAALVRPEVRCDSRSAAWLVALARESWKARHFFQAAVILESLPSPFPRDLPSRRLAYLAAVRDVEGPFSSRLLEICAEPADACELAGARLLAMRGLVAYGWDAAAELLREPIPGPGEELARALIENWWDQVGTPLPLEAIVALNQHAAHADGEAAARKRVVKAFEAGRTKRIASFEPGDLTLAELFGPEGLIAPLLSAVEQDRPGDAEHWMGTHGADVDKLVDEAWKRWGGRDRLRPPYRSTIVRLTSTALESVRDWIPSRAGAPPPLPTYQLKALSRLRDAVVASNDLATEPPLRVLAAMLRETLTPVLEWRSPTE